VYVVVVVVAAVVVVVEDVVVLQRIYLTLAVTKKCESQA
jgi:hypothetical protein